MATVTECHYEFGAGRALAFGVPRSKQFRIRFQYWVDGTEHTGEYWSETAVARGTLFPVRYDPEAPHHNDKAATLPTLRGVMLVVGVAGSVVLSLVWLVVLRGCS